MVRRASASTCRRTQRSMPRQNFRDWGLDDRIRIVVRRHPASKVRARRTVRPRPAVPEPLLLPAGRASRRSSYICRSLDRAARSARDRLRVPWTSDGSPRSSTSSCAARTATRRSPTSTRPSSTLSRRSGFVAGPSETHRADRAAVRICSRERRDERRNDVRPHRPDVHVHTRGRIRASPRGSRRARRRTHGRERRRGDRVVRAVGSSRRRRRALADDDRAAPASSSRRASRPSRRRCRSRTVRSTRRSRVSTIHHWPDWRRGLDEMRRVASRIVIFTFEPGRRRRVLADRGVLPGDRQLWTSREQRRSREIDRAPRPVRRHSRAGSARLHGRVPRRYWRRPEAYLDPVVRAGISGFALLPDDVVERGMQRLADDLASAPGRAATSENGRTHVAPPARHARRTVTHDRLQPFDWPITRD